MGIQILQHNGDLNNKHLNNINIWITDFYKSGIHILRLLQDLYDSDFSDNIEIGNYNIF